MAGPSCPPAATTAATSCGHRARVDARDRSDELIVVQHGQVLVQCGVVLADGACLRRPPKPSRASTRSDPPPLGLAALVQHGVRAAALQGLRTLGGCGRRWSALATDAV